MASKNVSSTLAGKIAHRSMAVPPYNLVLAAPLIADAIAGTTTNTVGAIGAGVISASFDPANFDAIP